MLKLEEILISMVLQKYMKMQLFQEIPGSIQKEKYLVSRLLKEKKLKLVVNLK